MFISLYKAVFYDLVIRKTVNKLGPSRFIIGLGVVYITEQGAIM